MAELVVTGLNELAQKRAVLSRNIAIMTFSRNSDSATLQTEVAITPERNHVLQRSKHHFVHKKMRNALIVKRNFEFLRGKARAGHILYQ